jgi:hypothetical protein
MCHLLWHTKCLYFAHRIYLRVSYDSQNNWRLLPLQYLPVDLINTLRSKSLWRWYISTVLSLSKNCLVYFSKQHFGDWILSSGKSYSVGPNR